MIDVRIAILSANDDVCAFLDNSVDKSLHYYNEKLHTYLQGSQYTFEATVSSDHDDSKNIVEGNHVSFRYRDHDYYCTIVNVEKSETEITFLAYGLTMELTNETVGAYEGSSKSITQYIDGFNFENTFTVGINEVSDKRISNKWDGTETILARLFSLANVFDSELEFVTELNENYSLKQITLNIYRKHSAKYQGMGEDRTGEIIRYGQGIKGIAKTSDITELYTAIRPTGKDGLTLANLGEIKEYDEDGNLEYYHEKNRLEIFAMQARERFPSLVMGADNDRWIANIWSYDTDNVNTLYGQALAQLKKYCVPKVSYEVDGYIDGNIGDTFTIEDAEFKPVLYVEARIIEQEISFTDSTKNKTTLDNFTELESQVNSDLLAEMNKLIEANKQYQLNIVSNNGLILPEGVDSTELRVLCRDGARDITNQFTYEWYVNDELFDTDIKAIAIDRSELDPSVVVRVDALDEELNIKATAEVTVATVENGKKGDKGVGIKTITSYYQVSTSNAEAPQTWLTTIPTMTVTDRYMWNYEVTEYTDGSKTETLKRVIGVFGDTGKQGKTGDKGTSVDSVVRYYQLATEKPSKPTSNPPTSPWTLTEPSFNTQTQGDLYYVILTTYSNNTWEFGDVQLSSDYQSIKVAYADALEQIKDTESKITTNFETKANSIVSEVTNSLYSKDDIDKKIVDLGTSITQSADKIEANFKVLETNITSTTDGLKAEFGTINKYIRAVDGNLILGEEGSDVVLTLENDAVYYTQNGEKTDSFSKNKSYMKDLNADVFTLNDYWRLTTRSNGDMDLRYIGPKQTDTDMEEEEISEEAGG